MTQTSSSDVAHRSQRLGLLVKWGMLGRFVSHRCVYFGTYMTRTALLFALLLCSIDAKADADDLVKSIKSVAAVVKEIKAAILNDCGTGGCADSQADDVCNLSAALDVKVGYQISKSQTSHGNPKSEMPITAKDLELLQLIYSQCRPTSYQYWNRDRMLHVVYEPTPEVAARVRKALGEHGN